MTTIRVDDKRTNYIGKKRKERRNKELERFLFEVSFKQFF